MNLFSRRACLKRFALAAVPNAFSLAVAETPTLSSAEIETIAGIAREAMTQGEIPGLSVAFSHGGKLAHSAGFGLANKERREKVTPAHRFRIASVSKSITATAIWSLIEAGKLKVDDKVFGPGGLLPAYKLGSKGPEIKDITLHHLLTHTCGGWGNKGYDPMFSHPEMNHEELISWTLLEMPLENAPGKAYAYSNFGYCVLGRVLESVTGLPYADLLQRHLLSKCGINGMKIAGNTLAERLPDEVIYYGQKNEDPYRATMNVRRMDSHGGWVATAEELVLFLTHVDGFATTPDILGSAAIQSMTTGSAVNAGYASGWSINSRPNWWHGGSLPGTSTLIVRTASGMCWAALANTRFRNEKTPDKNTGDILDKMMWRMARAVPGWKA